MEGSVLAVQLPLPRAEQLHFRAGGHKAFDGGEHLHEVGTVGGHQAGTHLRAPVLPVVPHLGHRNVVTALQFREQRPDNRAFLFEAVNVA